MPFEFSGAPPALLNTSSAFSSFAPRSQAKTPIATPSLASKSFPGPFRPQTSTGFGLAPSFGTASPFGSSVKPTFGSTPTEPSSTHSGCKTSTFLSSSPSSGSTDVVLTNKPPPNDTLIRALDRAAKGKVSIFGRGDVAADDILKSIFHGNKDEIQALSTGLREVETSSPAVAEFIRSLFDESVRRQRSQGQQPTVVPPAVLVSSAVEKTPKPSNDDQLTTNIHVEQPPAPRDHWRVKRFSTQLADLLLDEGYIWYEEGSRVLADYIIDLTYEHDQRAIVAKVVELLVRQDNDGAVDSVVHWARRKMQGIERDYFEDREDDSEEDHHDSNVSYVPDDRWLSAPSNNPRSTESTESAEDTSENEEQAVVETENKTFRFLDLPAELRNWVYVRLMAPGHIGFDQRHSFFNLHSKKHSAVTRRTTCNARILRTCRQIHDEAKNVLYENTVCVTGSLLEGMSPAIPQSLLPDHALSRLTSLTVTMVTIRTSHAKTPFERLDWKQLQHMTSLKKLRICVIEQEDQIGETNEKRRILEQIIERVPKDCELAFETREGFEDDLAQAIIEELDADKTRSRDREPADTYEVDGELLSTLAEEFKSKQGCKSGSKRDFRFPDRGINLEPLVNDDEINPSFVLGR